jgi:hypothetical protein
MQYMSFSPSSTHDKRRILNFLVDYPCFVLVVLSAVGQLPMAYLMHHTPSKKDEKHPTARSYGRFYFLSPLFLQLCGLFWHFLGRGILHPFIFLFPFYTFLPFILISHA